MNHHDKQPSRLPFNFININANQWLKCSEIKIDDQILNAPSISSNGTLYSTKNSGIFVINLFSGECSEFAPSDPKNDVDAYRFVNLCENRGVLIFEFEDKVHLAMVGLDCSKNTYAILGKTQIVPTADDKYSKIDDVSRLSTNLISIKTRSPEHVELYIYKLNSTLSKIEFWKSFTIDSESRWFKQFGDMIVYARTDSEINGHQVPPDAGSYLLQFCVHGISIMNFNGESTNFENTRKLFECYSTGGWYESKAVDFKYCWHKRRLFCLPNFSAVKYEPATVYTIGMFDLETYKWTKIKLNPLCMDSYSQLLFNMDDGILTCVDVKNIYDENWKWKNSKLKVLRYPFERPESLFNIALSKVRELKDRNCGPV